MTSHAILSIGLLSLIFISRSSHAQAPQNELRALLEVRSVTDLEQTVASAMRLSNFEAACRAELKAHALPRSCFVKLTLQKPIDSREFARLTRICRESAAKSQSQIDLADSRGLPDDCRLSVRSRLDDLQYADEESRPETAVNRMIGPILE